MNTDNLMTIPQYAEAMGICRQGVYHHIKTGRVETVRIVNKTYILKDSIRHDRKK